MIGPAGREAWRTIQNLMLAGEARDRMHRVCEDVDLTPAALKALLLLSVGPQAMRDMAGTFRCDPSYITGVVDLLERRGVARREPHPTDRRVKTVVLTDAGRETLIRAQAMLWEPPSSFAALTAAEQRQLRDLLGKVAAADPTLEPVVRAG